VRASQRGIALLIVISILAVVLILVVSFGLSMVLETRASRQFTATTQSRYLAEAGINHARAVLDEDHLGTRIDTATEPWVTQFAGGDADVDGNGVPESRWILVADASGHPVGRYAVKVTDESSKANLNTALADPETSGANAVNLTTLLSQAELSNASTVAQAVEQFRYGPDGKPGVALVDDDQNGAVDDASEYDPLALKGDDRRFDAMEELQGLEGLKADDFPKVSRVATVYTWDANVSVTGQSRVNINTATAAELVTLLLQTGAEYPWQLAANLADAIDPDLEMSRVVKTAKRYAITDQGALGSWSWQSGSGGYHTSSANGQPLTWTVSIPSSGSFYLLVHGSSGVKVGDVTLAGQTKTSMDSGDSFGVVDVGPLNGTLPVQVTDHEPAGTPCVFQSVELASTEPVAGFPTVTVRGIEPIRINELMVKPTVEFETANADMEKPQGSDWACVNGVCSNSGTGQATWTWHTELPVGSYYVRVYGTQAGQTVGSATVNGQAQTLVHGQRHPQTFVVGSDGQAALTIGKTSANGTYYFQTLSLSVEPDAEYLELINLSDQPVDLGSWVIEGEATGGRQAKFPTGTAIAAHGLLVALVDADDQHQAGLENNGISAASAWWGGSIPTEVPWVQLEFPNGPPTPDDDWLKTTLEEPSARLVLKSNQGWVVDEVEYLLPLPETTHFQSLEKGDPTVLVDSNTNGIDDGWYPSLELWTPGKTNNNSGLQEFKGSQLTLHNPAVELNIANHPLSTVGEIAGVPSGAAWSVIASADIARMVDRFTVQGVRLEAEKHFLEGGWEEIPDGYQTTQQHAIGTWQWSALTPGPYRLSLYGWAGEVVSVRWQQATGAYSEWSPPLSVDAQGRVVAGQMTIASPPASAAKTLTLDVRCESVSGVCHLMHVVLDPQLILTGLINVNTASQEVLLSLPGMTPAVAQQLIAARPFGDVEHKARGIGDLLAGSILGATEEDKLTRFRAWAHLVTVRSHVFRIFSLGESGTDATPSVAQRIEAVMQR